MFKTIKINRLLSLLFALCAIICSLFPALSVSAKSKVNTYSAPYGVTVSSYSEDTAKISWKLKEKLTKNSGFQVLVYSKKKGHYVNKGHIKKKSIVLTKLPHTDIRKIKIRTYVKKNKKKYYGESVLLKLPMPLERGELTSLTYPSKGKMNVSWKAVEGADGYIFQYSTDKGFNPANTSTLIFEAGESSKTIKGLGAYTYYAKISPFRIQDGVRYSSKFSAKKETVIEKGYTFKSMVNVNETDLSGRKAILKLTKKDVDISKYETTYDRLEAIYIWHKDHAQSFASCYYFTINFNKCVDALFGETKKFDNFIWMADGHFQNRSGGRPVHKWPVVFLQGVPYIMDGRMEGYIDTDCFGLTEGDDTYNRFLFSKWYMSYRPDSIFKQKFAVKYKVIE